LEREDQYLLYDIVKDPGETTNISGQHPDVVNQLSNRIHQWRREQIDYYDDVARQAREYPPYFED